MFLFRMLYQRLDTVQLTHQMSRVNSIMSDDLAMVCPCQQIHLTFMLCFKEFSF